MNSISCSRSRSRGVYEMSATILYFKMYRKRIEVNKTIGLK